MGRYMWNKPVSPEYNISRHNTRRSRYRRNTLDDICHDMIRYYGGEMTYNGYMIYNDIQFVPSLIQYKWYTIDSDPQY